MSFLWFIVMLCGFPIALVVSVVLLFVFDIPRLLWCIFIVEVPPEPFRLMEWWMLYCQRKALAAHDAGKGEP